MLEILQTLENCWQNQAFLLLYDEMLAKSLLKMGKNAKIKWSNLCQIKLEWQTVRYGPHEIFICYIGKSTNEPFKPQFMFPKTITFELQNFFVIYISYQTYLNLYQTYKPIFKVQMFTNILPNWTFYHLPEGCTISSLEIYHNFALLLSVLCLENLFYFVSAIFHYR